MKVNVFYDRSDLIERAVGTVEEALLEATVLVVVLLFLGDVRASVIVALAPMASLLTFIFMKSIGLTANLMSLGGLAIAVGMLVDGAVVVVENVVERLSDPLTRASKLAQCLCRGSRSGDPGGQRHGDHCAGVPAAADARRAGRQAVRAGRADDRACAAVGAGAGADVDPGAVVLCAEGGGGRAWRAS
jgi:hypothetical protein